MVDGLAENHYSVTPYNYVLNNPINTIDPFGLDTVPVNKVTPAVWHNFNTSGDNIALNEVSVTATRGATRAQAAYSSVQSEVQSDYRKRSGGLFMGYPSSLQGEVNSTFHEKYIAHNEINPFSGQGRVVGLEDANWLIDLAAGGIYSLTKTGAALAAERMGALEIPIYRVYGEGASMYGRSYSLINPKYVPFYRNFAGLPNVNSGQYLLKGYIEAREIQIGRWFAAPLDGNTGGLPFELYQNYNQLINPVDIPLKRSF